MNDAPNSCSKCQTPLTELKGGLSCCPSCGFAGEEKKADPEERTRASQKLFWLALVSPATLALLSFLVGNVSRDAGVMVGMGALVAGLIASAYCGFWIANRFCSRSDARVLVGLALMLVLGAVNFFIICAGCAGNLSFH